jgi:hypothetical protein
MATNTFVDLYLEETKLLADYTSIEFDLRSAGDFARLISEEWQKIPPNSSLFDPLMVATIIRYARAFAQGVRVNIYDEGASILTEEQRSKHELLMQIRNKYVAHSVNAFEESQPVARYWVEKVHEEGITSIGCIHCRVVGLNQQEVADIIDLTTVWLRYVQQKRTEEETRLLPIVRKLPLETLLQNTPRAVLADTSQPEKRRTTARRKRG